MFLFRTYVVLLAASPFLSDLLALGLDHRLSFRTPVVCFPLLCYIFISFLSYIFIFCYALAWFVVFSYPVR